MWLDDGYEDPETPGLPDRNDETMHGGTERVRREASGLGEWRWEIDGEFIVTRCSERVTEILGLRPEELIGRPFAEFLAPGEWDSIMPLLEKAARSRTPFQDRELWASAGDGQRVRLAITGAPVSDERGEHRGFRGIGRDITGRKQAGDALRERTSRYRELADTLPQTMFEIDPDGAILFANRSSLDMFGYDSVDPGQDLNASQVIAPQDRDRALANIRRTMAGTGESSCEYLALRKDGTTFPILVYSSTIMQDGKPCGLRGVIVDITERKRTETLMERIRDLALALGSATDLTEGLRFCLRAALDISGLECGGFYLADPRGGLRLAVHEGLSGEFLSAVSVYPPEAPNTMLVMGKLPVYCRAEELPPEISGDILREGLRLLALLPVLSGEGVLGCLNIASRVTGDIPVVIRDALEGMVAQVGNSIARLQAETALRQSEEQYRTLIENSTDIVMRFDRECRHRFVSNSVSGVAPMRPEDFLGKTHRELGFPPEQCEFWEERISRVFNSGLEYTDTFGFESIRGPVIFDWKLIPERNENGTVVSVLSISRDMTESTRMQEKLRQSESKFLFVANQLPGTMWTTDRNLVFTFAVGASLSVLGFTPGREMATPTAGPIADKEWENTIVSMHRRALAGEEVNYLHHLRGMSFETTLEPLRDSSGEITGVLGLAIDVTTRERERERSKHLEGQLLQSQKMETIGRFAGGIAHDFNNILTVILTQSDLALMCMGADNPLREAFEEIRKAGDRAADLTRKLLVFSRKEIVEPRVISINHVLLDMDKMFRRLIGENIELVTIPDESIPPVRIDPGHLEQVLINLALNARDAMPGGGTLTIETRSVFLDDRQVGRYPDCTPGRKVLLSVTDTGTGMDENTRSRAFEPFFSTKPQGSGTGLGLSTCYGIVRQNQGAVWIESAPGRGTTVRVFLPAVEDQTHPNPIPSAADTLPGGTETLLVAEDDASIRNLVVRLLSNAGYRVRAAANGTEALMVAGEIAGPIDLLITDVIMPLMGGPILARQLSAQRPGLRVLFMSGYADDSVVRHGVLAPGVAMVQKPFSTGAFLRKVREVLDGK